MPFYQMEDTDGSEMGPESRPIMPLRVFKAAMKGDNYVLISCLGLLEEPHEIQVAFSKNN